ncbi:MAG: tetratricopeptide repeat protein [Bacteroidota bacterium]
MSISRIDQLKEFLKEDPEDPFLHFALALELLKMNQLEEARDLLELLKNRKPDYLPTYYRLGKTYEELKRTTAALATYQEGIQLAKTKGEQHTLSELQSAHQNLLFSDD